MPKMPFTSKARRNFQISRMKIHPLFPRYLCLIKLACAKANKRLRRLDSKEFARIDRACSSLIRSGFKDFDLDVFQAGAGTSFHMHMNELIAVRARLHPNDHINMGQSTNNVIPTAIRLTSLDLGHQLLSELDLLTKSLRDKGRSFGSVKKVGRTHLQDAVEIFIKDEFIAYGDAVQRCTKRLKRDLVPLHEIGLGGNAVGTSINNPSRFRKEAVCDLARLTKWDLKPTAQPIMLTQSMQDFSALSGALNTLSLELGRICNDLRLLGMGPRAGLAEISLPYVQPGSSIMPGKVNPSIAECMNMICFHVQSSHQAISLAASSGQLEHNVFTPLIAHHLLTSIEILTNGVSMLREKCIDGIKLNHQRIQEFYDYSLCYATKLSPALGYDTVSRLVKESLRKHCSLRDLVVQKGLLTEAQVRKILK